MSQNTAHTKANRGKAKKSRKAPTTKQLLVFQALSENVRAGKGRPMGELLRNAGYSITASKMPKRITESKGFQELMEDYLPDNELMDVHKELLHTKRVDHMVFPLGPQDEDAQDDKQDHTTLTDEEITAMLADVGGTVRRIVHGQTARHVYFWVANDKARHDALKLAYDLKGKLGKRDGDPGAAATTYNTFIQANNINPNSPSAQQLVQSSLDVLMAQTKRKVIDV